MLISAKIIDELDEYIEEIIEESYDNIENEKLGTFSIDDMKIIIRKQIAIFLAQKKERFSSLIDLMLEEITRIVELVVFREITKKCYPERFNEEEIYKEEDEDE